jgi:hypothetical protein
MSQPLVPVGTQFTFVSPFSQFDERNGSLATVVGHVVVIEPDYDEEVLPMYLIRFVADGLEISAWPEEVDGS